MAASLQLIAIDNNEAKIMLPSGKSFIGRGPLLNCADKRISRKHAEINFDDESLTITPLHVNPCFYQGKEKTTWEELVKNEPKVLKDGDQFSFLRNSFRFEIRITKTENEDKEEPISKVNEATSSNTIKEEKDNQEADKPSTSFVSFNNDKENVKKKNHIQQTRILPKWLIQAAERQTQDNSTKEEPSFSKNLSKANTKKRNNSEKDEPSSTVSVQNKTNNKNKKEKTRDNEDEDEEPKKQKPKKFKRIQNSHNNEDENEIDDKAVSSTVNKKNQPQKKRTSCQFGKKCYRKNTLHFEEFCHPGDWDYNSDPETKNESEDDDEDKPECEYGTNCYRKNPQHWKEFKHSKRPQRTAAKKARAKAKYDDDDDDDEYDDSFIDDDDSDCYDPKQDYSSEEDIQELKRDAIAFQKNKKLIKPV